MMMENIEPPSLYIIYLYVIMYLYIYIHLEYEGFA